MTRPSRAATILAAGLPAVLVPARAAATTPVAGIPPVWPPPVPGGNPDHVVLSVLLLGIIGLGLATVGVAWTVRRLRASGPWDRSRLSAGLAVLIAAAWFVHVCVLAPFRNNDEVANFAQALVGTFTFLDIPLYWHPTLFTNTASVAYAAWILLTSFFGGMSVADASAEVVVHDWLTLLVIGRLLASGAWLGAGGIAWKIADRCGRPGAGLLAFAAHAGTSIITTYHVTCFSMYGFAVFLTTLFAWHVVFRHADSTPRVATGRESAIAGLLFGAAVGTHGLALWFLPLFLLGLRGLDRRKIARQILIFGPAALAAWQVANPWFLPRGIDYLALFGYRLTEAVQEEHESSFWMNVLSLFSWVSCFWFVGMAGVVWHVIDRVRGAADRGVRWAERIALGFWLVLAMLSTKAGRYHLYLIPHIAVLVGVAFAGRPWAVGRRFVPVALAAALFGQNVLTEGILLFGTGNELRSSLAQGNPIPIALDWIEERTAPGETVVLLYGFPYFSYATRDRGLSAEFTDRLGSLAAADVADGRTVRLYMQREDDRPPVQRRHLEGASWLYVLRVPPSSRSNILLDDGTVLEYDEQVLVHGTWHLKARLPPRPRNAEGRPDAPRDPPTP